MNEIKIDIMPISELKPYEKNARKHQSEDVGAIVASIKEFGFNDPIGVWSDENIIVEGHGRLEAAKALGLEVVPVIHLDHLTDEQRRAYALAHNKTAELSLWDDDLLNIELDNILDIDMSEFGFDLDDEETEETEIVEDEAPEPPTEPKAKIGDLYLVGGHRLICGDSTDVAVIDRLMDGAKADMVFTDPPYNVNYDEKEKRLLKYRPNARVKDDINTGIENDNIGDYETFCNNIAWIISQKTDGCVYVCGAQGKDGRTLFKAFDDKIHNSTTIIWNKPHFVLGDGKYQSKYEPIWFGWVKSGKSFTDDRTLTNVWDIDKPQKSELHPTMKPLELVATAIKHNPKIKSVLDLFGGSGSTLIACEQLNRKCFMCELDPHYIDVIIQRYINLKGTDTDIFLIRDGKKIPYSEINV